MTEEKSNERVTMEWPKELKAQVRDKTGPRGLTEFVIEAVQIHLSGTNERIAEQELELNSTKHLVQLLADRLAMGGDPVDRLSSMMEIELPAWIDTTGWPNEYAKLVRPDLAEEVIPEYGRAVSVGEVRDAPKMSDCPSPLGTVCTDPTCPVHFKRVPHISEIELPRNDQFETPVEDATEPAPELDVPADAATPVAPKEPWTPDLPHDRQGGDDLFARVMAKTGGKVDGLEGLKDHLKPASEIPKPEPVVQKDLCPTCNEELVDGECWTCET